jgi:hypothetical protein
MALALAFRRLAVLWQHLHQPCGHCAMQLLVAAAKCHQPPKAGRIATPRHDCIPKPFVIRRSKFRVFCLPWCRPTPCCELCTQLILVPWTPCPTTLPNPSASPFLPDTPSTYITPHLACVHGHHRFDGSLSTVQWPSGQAPLGRVSLPPHPTCHRTQHTWPFPTQSISPNSHSLLLSRHTTLHP